MWRRSRCGPRTPSNSPATTPRRCRNCSTSWRTSTTCRTSITTLRFPIDGSANESTRMKVLVIGGGGREHALAWRLAQSLRVSKIYVAPGNGGTRTDGRYECVDISEPAALRAWAQQEKISLTVVGPEAPLAAGVVDEFRAHGMRIFGPTKAAAQLESSKAFSKSFMKRHGIPTAEYEAFTDAAAAHAYVDAKGAPIVIKADGLA